MQGLSNLNRALRAGAVAGVFILVEGAFFTSNHSKVASGGYVPLIVAAFAFGIMIIWHRGAQAVSARLYETTVPIGQFIADISQRKIPRVPGTAIFLTRTNLDVLPVLVSARDKAGHSKSI